MGMLSTIITNEREIARICGEIKTSANNKGANIGEFQPLNEWPAQIDTITSKFQPIIYVNNNKISGIELIDELRIPESYIDSFGQVVTMPNSLSFYNNEANFSAICNTKKLIIPYHFTNATPYSSLPNSDTWGQYACRLEEIEFYGTGKCSCVGTGVNGASYRMRRLYFPNMTGNTEVGYLRLPSNVHFEIVAPKSLQIHECKLKAIDNTPVTLTGDFTSVTKIQNASNSLNSVGFNYVTGDLSFPACTTLGNIAISAYDLTLRLPALTTMYYSFETAQSGTGITTLYIGGNVSNVDMNTQDKILANADRIEIHIPAGDSTTKTTLDSAGIPYIQDYVI